MKGRVKVSDKDVTYRDHIKNKNLFPNSIKHHKSLHTSMVYISFSMGVKYVKTSELVAWNCKSFTYGFLGFQPTENRNMKLQSKTSYMFVTTPSKSDNIPHTNMIQDSFKIEAKVMETSDSTIAWECKSFTYGFYIFQATENRDMKLQSNFDVFVTSECIHLCILCIVTRCLFRDVSIMYLSHVVMPRCSD